MKLTQYRDPSRRIFNNILSFLVHYYLSPMVARKDRTTVVSASVMMWLKYGERLRRASAHDYIETLIHIISSNSYGKEKAKTRPIR